MDLKFSDRCYESQIQKEKYNMSILILLILSIVGIMSTILYLSSEGVAWQIVGAANVYALVVLIISVISTALLLLSLVNASVKIKFCEDVNSKSVCFSSPIQKSKHMMLLIMLLVISIAGASFTFATMSSIGWVLSDAPYTFVSLLVSVGIGILTILGMYRAATKIEFCAGMKTK
jgi:hypothetical protein